MKRLVSILLLVFVVATGFAQSSNPDYIQKAKVGLNQYYPQFKDYFEPIFAEYNKMVPNVHKVLNSKIHDNFDTFEEEIATERDKCTTTLIILDILLGDKTFMNSKKQVDSSEGVEMIDGIAAEIATDINIGTVKELKRSKERLAKVKAVVDKIKANNNESPEGILNSIEMLFEISEIEEVKTDPTIQEIIKYYISISQKANHTPSPLGQKFIDEYNRITKSK